MRFGLVSVIVAPSGRCGFWKLLLQVLKWAVVLGALVAVGYGARSWQSKTILTPDRPPLVWKRLDVNAVFSTHTFRYSFNVSSEVVGICKGVRVMVIVPSQPDRFKTRERNPKGMLIRFLIGQTEDRETAERLESESAEHNDIVRFDYPDEYDLLTIKTHAALYWKWHFCPEADYLLKTDDDTVVDLDRVRHFIETDYDARRLPSVGDMQRAFFICQVFTGHKPFRDPHTKYYVSSKSYPNSSYPLFCQGCSYMLTAEAVGALLNHTHLAPYMRLEDVLYSGLVAGQAHLPHVNSPGFGNDVAFFRDSVDCDIHGVPLIYSEYGVSVDRMAGIYRRLKEQKCVKKVQQEQQVPVKQEQKPRG